MTCTTSMCLSKLETSSRPSISVFSPSLFLSSSPRFILSLSHFWFFLFLSFISKRVWFSTLVYTSVCVCAQFQSVYSFFRMCSKKGNVLGFMSTYIKTHSTIQYWISSSSSFSFPSQKFHVPFFRICTTPYRHFCYTTEKSISIIVTHYYIWVRKFYWLLIMIEMFRYSNHEISIIPCTCKTFKNSSIIPKLIFTYLMNCI